MAGLRVEEEGHVRSQRPGQLVQFGVAHVRPSGLAEDLRAHLQRGGRVGAAAAHAGGQGMPLSMLTRPEKTQPVLPLQRPQSMGDDVGLRLDGVGLHVQFAGPVAGRPGLQAEAEHVVHVHRDEHREDLVVTRWVRPAR